MTCALLAAVRHTSPWHLAIPLVGVVPVLVVLRAPRGGGDPRERKKGGAFGGASGRM
jgi:hypothetical protein